MEDNLRALEWHKETRHARRQAKIWPGKLWPIWGEKTDCTDWNQLLPISCDAFENYEVKLNPGLSPWLVASRRVWHMSSIYSHIPLPLCMCSESQIPLRGPFLGQRYSFSKAGASSVSLCSGLGCAAGLLRWVRSGWHFTSLADVSRRAEVQVSPELLCPLAIQTRVRIMTLRLLSVILLDAK